MMQRKSKRARNKVKKRMIDNDRISRLPESVIHHIFSFIDTKFVVQSSVLSSRWRNTWKSHPRLKFESDRSTNHTDNFRVPKFVHRFLSHRDNSIELPIIDVSLNSIRLLLLKNIIMYAMSHRTQKLNIEFLGEGPTRRGGFDISIFRSQFLQHLCLEIDFVILKTPTLTWDLPALTTLKLQCVKFTLHPPVNGGRKSLELFSHFPNLKSLVLIGCELFDIDCFIIMSNGLENLDLRDYNQTCEFVISAPKLSSFTFYGMAHSSLLAPDLQSLVRVKFHTIHRRSLARLELVDMMINTFYQLREAKFLTLNSDVSKFLIRFPELLERRPCPFMRLESLTFVEPQVPPCSFWFSDVLNYFRSSSPAMMVDIEIDPFSSISRD